MVSINTCESNKFHNTFYRLTSLYTRRHWKLQDMLANPRSDTAGSKNTLN